MNNEKKKGIYRKILSEKEYRKLLFSNLINRFGDSVEAIAFTWMVYQITHSAVFAAVILALLIMTRPALGKMEETLSAA